MTDTDLGLDIPPLDLTDADTSGGDFEPIPSGRYNGVVWEVKWDATKEDSQGALGPNTPYVAVQFALQDNEKYNNRRFFNSYFPVAPEGYDPEKAAKNKGTFVNFLVACGYTEAEVKAPGFTLPDFGDLSGREVVLSIGTRKNDYKSTPENTVMENYVAGVKPRTGNEVATGAAAAGGII